MYVSETSCMKRASAHNKNMGIKALKSQGLRICFDRLFGCDYFSGPSRNGPMYVVVVTHCNLALELKLIESFFNLSCFVARC